MLSSRMVQVQESHHVVDLDEALMVIRFAVQTIPFLPTTMHIHLEPAMNSGQPGYALFIAGLVRSEDDIPDLPTALGERREPE